ncbi:MAG: hypothetical protein RR348_03505, partial [Clostridia bacterium]
FNKERLFLFVICGMLFVACLSSTFLQEIFAIVPLTTNMVMRLMILLACVLPCMAIMYAEVDAVKIMFNNSKKYFLKWYAVCRKPFAKMLDKRKKTYPKKVKAGKPLFENDNNNVA